MSSTAHALSALPLEGGPVRSPRRRDSVPTWSYRGALLALLMWGWHDNSNRMEAITTKLNLALDEIAELRTTAAVARIEFEKVRDHESRIRALEAKNPR